MYICMYTLAQAEGSATVVEGLGRKIEDHISPIRENQMENNMENEMETTIPV